MNTVNKNREGYKETILGWIPKEWDTPLMSELTLSSAFGPRFPSSLYSKNGAVATLRTTDLDKEGNIDFDYLPCANLDLKSFQNHFLQKKDLVITRSGTIGIVGIFESFNKPVIPGAFLIRFRLNQKIGFPNFIRYYFCSKKGHQRLLDSSSGGVQKNLTGTSVLSLEIPLPPLPEQRAIAKALSTMDTAINLNNQLIAQKELRKKWLMQNLLTGRKRLEGFSGEWKRVKLGDVGEFSKGAGVSKAEIRKTGFPAIRYGEIYTTHHFIVKRVDTFIDSDSTQNSKVVYKGDILFAGSGETLEEIGKCVTYNDNIEAYAGGDIIIFRPRNLNNIFLSYLLNSDPIIKQKVSIGKGHSVVHIYPKDLASIRVNIPSIDEQTAIAKVLQSADKEIELRKAKTEKLREQKKGMMQVLLTGKKRLKISEQE